MPKLALHMLLAALGLLQASLCTAAPDKPPSVQDLPYGEVLYHFYQQDYFTAITHLMAAQQQKLLKHHAAEAELLLGGMQLSYGMLNEAAERFNRFLDESPDPVQRNRAWYYLARIAYQRGDYDTALAALSRIDKPRDRTAAAEIALLKANIYMLLGEDGKAVEVLEKARGPKKGLDEYLRINLGIALLRAGEVEKGRAVLDKLGNTDSSSEELRALRDRANLALGYELIRAGDAVQARKYLSRVRLKSPFVHAALLGAGWADAENGDYRQALTPWLSLVKLGEYEAPVQEAHLAVPYAFSQLGDNKRATYYYELAIDFYDQEQKQLEQAIADVNGGSLLRILDQVDTRMSGGWLNDASILRDIPSGRYLVDVLAEHDFQETLKDYRDLGYLHRLLDEWLENIDIYHGMVDARRLAYEQRAPEIRKKLEQDPVATLEQRWRFYRQLVDTRHQHDDPLRLATSGEKRQLALLDSIQERLSQLPQEARYDRMRDKAKWLRGVLQWQIQSDYKARLWNTEKLLRTIRPLLDDAEKEQHALARALDTARANFDGYDGRIKALRRRITELIPAIEAAQARATRHLKQLALQELETRRQRLASYRSQARYALARSYDQLSEQYRKQP